MVASSLAELVRDLDERSALTVLRAVIVRREFSDRIIDFLHKVRREHGRGTLSAVAQILLVLLPVARDVDRVLSFVDAILARARSFREEILQYLSIVLSVARQSSWDSVLSLIGELEKLLAHGEESLCAALLGAAIAAQTIWRRCLNLRSVVDRLMVYRRCSAKLSPLSRDLSTFVAVALRLFMGGRPDLVERAVSLIASGSSECVRNYEVFSHALDALLYLLDRGREAEARALVERLSSASPAEAWMIASRARTSGSTSDTRVESLGSRVDESEEKSRESAGRYWYEQAEQ